MEKIIVKKQENTNEKLTDTKEKMNLMASIETGKSEFNEDMFFEELRKKIEMKTEN